jgi:hypothetical protein
MVPLKKAHGSGAVAERFPDTGRPEVRCDALPHMVRSMTDSEQADRQQVVYVITGDSLASASRYVDGACLSIHSLRRFHPSASVVCACDRPIHAYIRAAAHPLADLVDGWIDFPDADGGPVHRSRSIKTSLRQRIGGPFVYLDADTLVSGPLDELFASPTDVGFTVDRFFPEAPGSFPAWLRPFYDRLEWQPTARYFSGGIFHAADTPAAAALFSAWHASWRRTVEIGIVSDQPSLNRAIATTPHAMTEYPESFNWFVGRADREIGADTRVISFLASQEAVAASYEGLLERFAVDHTVDSDRLVALTSAGASYVRQRKSFARRLRERFSVGMKFLATRHGLRDPRRE